MANSKVDFVGHRATSTRKIIPALTVEARLKRRLRAHLREIGFSRGAQGELIFPGHGKEVIRALHSHQRKSSFDANRHFLNEQLPRLAKFFAEGHEVNLGRIQLSLQQVRNIAVADAGVVAPTMNEGDHIVLLLPLEVLFKYRKLRFRTHVSVEAFLGRVAVLFELKEG